MEELLRNNNLKVTKQRVDILNTINELKLESTIKNIINKLDMDQSTVYRTLKTLEENNIVEKNIINDEVIYMIKEKHQHYFKCVKCHKITEIDHCPMDLSNELEGYKILSHQLILDGICNNCQK